MEHNWGSLGRIWKDQAEFNENFFPPAQTFEEKSRQTKEFVLHLMSELDELLRHTVWKKHRNLVVRPNPAAVREELSDILKYLISLYLVWDVSPEDMIKGYWEKSMVCRQRFSEEFVVSLEGPIALVDIDNVLADYTTGFLHWIQSYEPGLRSQCERLIKEPTWLMPSVLGVTNEKWQDLKHIFRTTGMKRLLPLCDGAPELLRYLKNEKKLRVVLLTSRPIDKYPNLYTDTLFWLNGHNLEYDAIWWASDKGEKLLESGCQKYVQIAVDDDPTYVRKLAALGIRVFWVHGWATTPGASNPDDEYGTLVTRVAKTKDIINLF